MLGDGNKVRYSPLTAQQRFTALQSGEVDMLSRNTTWTLTRDASLGLHFTGVTYYDGQGFMVPKSLNVKSAKQLKGADRLRAVRHHHREEPDRLLHGQQPATSSRWCSRSSRPPPGAYFAGRCQAYTTDASGLASMRSKEAQKPDDHVILPELISKEPLGPAVRRGDDEFFAIVKWVVFALLEAEEYGITQANVDQMKADSKTRRDAALLGTHRRHRQAARPGQGLGLPRHQGRRQLRRDLRAQRRPEDRRSELPRGPNNLWNKGGLMYAPPVR